MPVEGELLSQRYLQDIEHGRLCLLVIFLEIGIIGHQVVGGSEQQLMLRLLQRRKEMGRVLLAESMMQGGGVQVKTSGPVKSEPGSPVGSLKPGLEITHLPADRPL